MPKSRPLYTVSHKHNTPNSRFRIFAKRSFIFKLGSLYTERKVCNKTESKIPPHLKFVVILSYKILRF